MSVRIVHGDCRDVLRTLPDQSVQCCVTSPPYYGLRDYKVDGQIGLESSPQEYVDQMVQVFGGVLRVLRDDGTVWLNIGDSYASGVKGANNNGEGVSTLTSGARAHVRAAYNDGRGRVGRHIDCGLPEKNLLGIPWRVAFALQENGWYLRSAIVWAKPNPMPESCTDRPTSSYEMVFLLSKCATYFYDADAIKEEGAGRTDLGIMKFGGRIGTDSGWHNDGGSKDANGRNCRNVWTIATQPYVGAHFATMPPDLAERCVKAGTSERGCCPSCGAPWQRIIERGEPDLEHQRACGGDSNGEYLGRSTKNHAAAGVQDASAVKARILAGMVSKRTSGWEPTCSCQPHDPVPCVVLDPFGGAGTTGLVADRLGRDAILIELNPEYAGLTRDRITDDCPLFASIA